MILTICCTHLYCSWQEQCCKAQCLHQQPMDRQNWKSLSLKWHLFWGKRPQDFSSCNWHDEFRTSNKSPVFAWLSTAVPLSMCPLHLSLCWHLWRRLCAAWWQWGGGRVSAYWPEYFDSRFHWSAAFSLALFTSLDTGNKCWFGCCFYGVEERHLGQNCSQEVFECDCVTGSCQLWLYLQAREAHHWQLYRTQSIMWGLNYGS